MNHVSDTAVKEKKQIKKRVAKTSEALADSLKDRVEQARDVVESVRDKAEVAFREKPYLVPVAAGVGGFAVGLLFGSKLTRLLVFTAVGTFLSDTLSQEVKRIAGDFLGDLQDRLGDGSDDTAEDS